MKGHVSDATEPLYIVMPFKAKGMAKLFSTHPRSRSGSPGYTDAPLALTAGFGLRARAK